MRKNYIVAALALATTPMTGAMAAMDVATFLGKADALRAKGPMALFSSDIGLLKREVTTASGALRAERLAEVKAGRKPAYCPPAKGSMNSDELLAAMRAVPPTERPRTDIGTVLRSIMIRKFPCPAR